MKINKNLKIKHALNITVDELKRLVTFISAKFPKGGFVAKCEDGTKIEGTLEDIIEYENPSYRKIHTIMLSAGSENSSIDLALGSEYQILNKYGEVDLRFDNVQDFAHFQTELEKRLTEFKPWYSFITQYSATGILFAVFALVVFLGNLYPIILRMRGTPVPSAVPVTFGEMLTGGTILAGAVLLIGTSLDKVKNWMFPPVFFSIGKQADAYGKKKAAWGIVFGACLLAFIVNVASNWFWDRVKAPEPTKVEPTPTKKD